MGRLQENGRYPELIAGVQGIAKQQGTLARARPLLRDLAIEHKAPLYQLVDAYLAMRPRQIVTCRSCGEDCTYDHQLAGKCFDCLLVEHLPW